MKYISIILITMIIATIGYAQPQQRQRPPRLPNAEKIEKMVEELSQQLELTDKQKENVSSIFNAHFEEAKEIREKNRKTMEGLRKALVEQVTAEIGADKEEEFKDYMKSKRSERKGGKRPPSEDK